MLSLATANIHGFVTAGMSPHWAPHFPLDSNSISKVSYAFPLNVIPKEWCLIASIERENGTGGISPFIMTISSFGFDKNAFLLCTTGQCGIITSADCIRVIRSGLVLNIHVLLINACRAHKFSQGKWNHSSLFNISLLFDVAIIENEANTKSR